VTFLLPERETERGRERQREGGRERETERGEIEERERGRERETETRKGRREM
jgi:hypothetical protein